MVIISTKLLKNTIGFTCVCQQLQPWKIHQGFLNKWSSPALKWRSHFMKTVKAISKRSKAILFENGVCDHDGWLTFIIALALLVNLKRWTTFMYAVADPDLEIRGGGGLQKNFFRPFGPQFGLKIKRAGKRIHLHVFWLMFACSFCISQAGVFMGFSITSAVMGGVIIICYSIVISGLSDYYDYSYGRGYYSYRGKMAILAIMLILGIIAFGAGIWAAICACLMKPCACWEQPQVSWASAVSFWKWLRNSSQAIWLLSM